MGIKLNKRLAVAGGSLMVTLPTMWIKSNKLQKGKIVILELEEDSIRILKPQ